MPFVPTDISDLTAWFDAEDTSTVTEATGVSQWDDKSGNANHLTQGTAANQPTYQTTGGFREIDFDGSNDYLAISSQLLDVTDAFTVVLVYNPATWTKQVLSQTEDSSSSQRMFIEELNVGNYRLRIGNDAGGVQGRDTIKGRDVKGIAKINSASGLNFTIEAVAQPPAAAISMPATPFTFSRFEIGRTEYSGFIGYAEGAIQALLIYQKNVTGTEWSDLKTYLADRHGAVIQDFPSDAILDETGAAILDETGDFILEEMPPVAAAILDELGAELLDDMGGTILED